jgi:hypothetical protein
MVHRGGVGQGTSPGSVVIPLYPDRVRQVNSTPILGPIAQRLEQRTHNPLVLGSNPSGPTIGNQRVRRANSFVLKRLSGFCPVSELPNVPRRLLIERRSLAVTHVHPRPGVHPHPRAARGTALLGTSPSQNSPKKSGLSASRAAPFPQRFDCRDVLRLDYCTGAVGIFDPHFTK